MTATSNDTQTAEGFQRFLNQSHAAYIAVLGHSENGILRFPDGSPSTLTEMARQCAAQGKRCIFPVCVSDKPPGHDPGPGSLDSALCLKDPTDALRAVQKLMERQPGSISLAKLLTENLKPYPYLMRYLIDKSVGSGAVIAVTISLNVGPRPDPTASTVEDPPGNTQDPNIKPFPLNLPRPSYTEEALQNKVQGRVRLRVLVGTDGKVKRVHVLSGLPDGLSEEAIRAAHKMRFRPAIQAGVPAEMWQTVEIEFYLRQAIWAAT